MAVGRARAKWRRRAVRWPKRRGTEVAVVVVSVAVAAVVVTAAVAAATAPATPATEM